VPYPVEVNDSPMIVHRNTARREFCDMGGGPVDEMLEQCAKHPLVCNISIHPYVFGSLSRFATAAHRAQTLCRAQSAGPVWWTRPGEIAEFCNP